MSNNVSFGVRMPTTLVEKVDQAAEKCHRSRSAMLRLLVVEGLSHLSALASGLPRVVPGEEEDPMPCPKCGGSGVVR